MNKTAGKYFAIGDIHGCMGMLEALWDSLDFNRETDTLVFVGDYIDRGPDSKEVVDFVLDLQSTVKCICLLGNHEQMLLTYFLHNSYKEFYLMNGGTSTVASYGLINSDAGKKINIPPGHLDFFRNLIHYYETEDYIFVHAGLKPGVPLAKQDPTDLIWIREEFIGTETDFGKKVVFGHTPLPRPLISPNKIGIDTGAVYGGKLTCIKLPDEIIYQV